MSHSQIVDPSSFVFPDAAPDDDPPPPLLSPIPGHLLVLKHFFCSILSISPHFSESLFTELHSSHLAPQEALLRWRSRQTPQTLEAYSTPIFPEDSAYAGYGTLN